MAAQAGVRYSIENPRAYVDSNLVGFANVLECCRNYQINHLVYASSSSVYGGNTKVPFSTNDLLIIRGVFMQPQRKPVNLWLIHIVICIRYQQLIKIFYRLWFWETDMALFKFTESILENKKIQIYNHGNHEETSHTLMILLMDVSK